MNFKYFYNKILAAAVCPLLILVIIYSFSACQNHKEAATVVRPYQESPKQDTVKKGLANVRVLSLPLGERPKNIKDVTTYDADLAQTLLVAALPVYKLPPIKRAEYVIADKNYGLGLCYDNPVNITLKNFKYRLPDCRGLQVYYMTGDAERTHELKEEFNVDCLSVYGNLIVYNPKTLTAKVLTIYYSFYMDSQQLRYFYIDKEYNLYIAEASYSEGETGADFNAGSIFKVVITSNGGFDITKIYEQK